MNSISLPPGNVGKSAGEKSETRTPATRIATNPNGTSVHVVVSLPARLILQRAGRLSTGFHKYANVIYRPPHPNPLPPKRGEKE